MPLVSLLEALEHRLCLDCGVERYCAGGHLLPSTNMVLNYDVSVSTCFHALDISLYAFDTFLRPFKTEVSE